MHLSSYITMQKLLETLAKRHLGRPLSLLDVGSRLADKGNRTYRTHAESFGYEYLGLDVQAGFNVDIVSADPYKFPLPDASVDVVISGQVFEHIEFPWESMREVARVLRPGGCAMLIAPSSGPEHRYPLDCWRYYPDGMRALGKWSGLECVHASTFWMETELFLWGDTVGIFSKPGNRPLISPDTVATLPTSCRYSASRTLALKAAYLLSRAGNFFRWSQKS